MFILTALLMTLSCTSGDDGNNNNVNTQGYNPYTVGSSWEYNKTGENALLADANVVVKVESTAEVKGKNGYKLSITEGSSVDNDYVVFEDDSVYVYDDADGDSLEGVEPEDMEKGERWTSNVYVKGNDGFVQAVDSCNAEVEEEVEVPAGTFTALKVYCLAQTSVGDDLTGKLNVRDEKIVYKVKGVGIVKKIIMDYVEVISPLDTLVVADTVVWELNKYDIKK